MRTVLSSLILALTVACGGSSEPAPAPSTSAPVVAAPAPTPAPPPPAAQVGPDGPADLAVATYALSTDAAVIAEGEKIFAAKGCGGCHAFGKKLVGPDLVGIADRRPLPWIGRMIRYPDQMIKADPVAKDLYRQLMTPMANQGVTDAELAPLVSFLASKKGA
jgi:hypothetical protein